MGRYQRIQREEIDIGRAGWRVGEGDSRLY